LLPRLHYCLLVRTIRNESPGHVRRYTHNYPEAADNGIEAIGRIWEIVCKGDIKLRVPDSTPGSPIG